MKISKIFVSAIILTIFGTGSARAQSLSDILGGNLGNTITNLVEGVFSSSNITVADMTGEWHSTGPAVCFQSDNFLKKAGGIAAASAVETKLQPYYEKYGLNNSVLTVNSDGTFTLNCGKLVKLSGTITQAPGAQQGVFSFNFTALGMQISSVTTYVQKTSSSMDVMFDATKLKTLLSTVAQFSGIQMVQTVTSILDSYEGLCIGFNLRKTSNGNDSGIINGIQNGGSNNGSGFNLGNILSGFGIGGNNDGSTTNTTTEIDNKSGLDKGTNPNNNNNQNNQNSTNSNDALSKGLNLLKGILGR